MDADQPFLHLQEEHASSPKHIGPEIPSSTMGKVPPGLFLAQYPQVVQQESCGEERVHKRPDHGAHPLFSLECLPGSSGNRQLSAFESTYACGTSFRHAPPMEEGVRWGKWSSASEGRI